jgi:restriction modification system S chain homolog
LGEAILEAYQGINTASDKVEYSLSGIPILQAKHITNGQINYRDTRYLDMDIYEHYISKYMPKKGEILFANIGTIGPSVLVDSDKMFLIAWNILKMSIKTNYSAVFIKITLSLLNSKHFFERITTGNATKFINKDEIMDIRISVPPLEEQQAIGAYFSNLDNLISSHQEKISQLEILKKKLLQDMFI